MTGALGRHLRRWTGEKRLQLAAEGAARCLPWVVGPGAALWALDALTSLPREARLAGWILWSGAALRALWFWVARPQWELGPLAVLGEAGRLRPRLAPYLVSAWELASGRVAGGVSRPLAEAHVRQADAALERETGRLFEVALRREEARSALAAAALALVVAFASKPGDLRRVLAPWREPALEDLVSVRPGDADVAWGQSAAVTAAWRSGSRPGLELWLRSPSSPWRRQDWDSPGSFRLASVTEPVDYRVSWRDLRSRVYRLRPVAYPHFEELTVTVRFPSYTRLPPETSDRAGDLVLLEGSRVEVAGRPDRPLRSALLRVSNLPSPVSFSEEGGRRLAAFVPSGEGTFRWELEDEAGFRDPDPPTYRFRTKPDEPPTIELLSPSFDAEASPREPFRLTYEAADDYGLSRVEVEYEEPTGRAGTARLEAWADSPRRVIGDASMDLSAFAPGEVVEYRLAAVDTRGQKGRSKTNRVKIVDFEGEHEKVREEAARLLGALEGLGTREAELADKLTAVSSAAETAPAGAEAEQSELEQSWPEAAAAMERLAKRLDEDPLANPGLQLRYQDLARRLRAAASRPADARRSLVRRDWPAAAGVHRELQREADDAVRGLAQGESLQTYEDFWAEGQRMADQGRNLEQALGDMQGRKLGAGEARRLAEAMGELQQRMDALAAAIKRLPKPDAKAQEGRRKFLVPLGEAQSLSARLQDALRRGDVESALSLARRLSDALGRVQRALADAQEAMAADMLGEHPLSKQLQEAELDWQRLVEAQSDLVEGLGSLEAARLERKLALQRKLLAELAERQKALRSSAPADYDAAMSGIEQQFLSGRLTNAESLLRSIIGAASTTAGGAALAAAEQSVLDRLEAGVEALADAAACSAAARRQRDLRAQGLALEKKLSELPVDRKPLRTLREAGAEMEAAASELDKPDGDSGLKHASRALELLQQGLDEQEQQRREQAQAEEGLGRRPSTAGVRPLGGGRTGARTGFVELPSSKDYRPAPELRQEILRSLEERYPRSYEGIIKDYLKRLSQ